MTVCSIMLSNIGTGRWFGVHLPKVVFSTARMNPVEGCKRCVPACCQSTEVRPWISSHMRGCLRIPLGRCVSLEPTRLTASRLPPLRPRSSWSGKTGTHFGRQPRGIQSLENSFLQITRGCKLRVPASEQKSPVDFEVIPDWRSSTALPSWRALARETRESVSTEALPRCLLFLDL